MVTTRTLRSPGEVVPTKVTLWLHVLPSWKEVGGPNGLLSGILSVSSLLDVYSRIALQSSQDIRLDAPYLVAAILVPSRQM